jgi:cytochrome c oxidase cbb3-type subunit 3
MSDFIAAFWAYYIAALTIVSIVGCWVLLRSQTTKRVPGAAVGTTGHVWDEDLQERNNPLPNWWRWLFIITIVFGLGYLVFYPGLAAWSGTLKWSSTGQYDAEQARAEATYGPLYAKYLGMPIEQVAADPAAIAIGQNLYLNNCAQCHASDARGTRGFPNLADRDWLWGGDAKTIVQTISGGRNGIMPPFGAVLGGDGTKDTAHYVMSLSGLAHDSIRAARGKEKFAQVCAACHGADGKGNPALGAPNLTDKIWLYGSGEPAIIETITQGRNNVMPAWQPILGAAKVHVLAAYVWSLSNEPAKAAVK